MRGGESIRFGRVRIVYAHPVTARDILQVPGAWSVTVEVFVDHVWIHNLCPVKRRSAVASRLSIQQGEVVTGVVSDHGMTGIDMLLKLLNDCGDRFRRCSSFPLDLLVSDPVL